MRKDEGPLDLGEAYKVLAATLTLARADLRQLEKLVAAEDALNQLSTESQQWFWSHLFHNLRDLGILRTASLFDQDPWHHVGSVQAVLEFIDPHPKRRSWWRAACDAMHDRVPAPSAPPPSEPKRVPARIVLQPGEEFWPGFARLYRRRLADQELADARRMIREVQDKHLAHAEVLPGNVAWSLDALRLVQGLAEEFVEDLGEALLGIINPKHYRDWGNGSASQLDRLMERVGIREEPWWRRENPPPVPPPTS